MTTKDIAMVGLVTLLLGAAATAVPVEAQQFRGNRVQSRDGFGGGFVYGGLGIGRAAFPIPGAIPAGTPYDPYRLPYSYDWPYGYGYSGR